MTAISTIFGMIPMAIGHGDGGEWRAPIGAIALGGMTSSTLLTLLVVPVIYTLVDDAQAIVMRAWSRVGRRVRGLAVRSPRVEGVQTQTSGSDAEPSGAIEA
jgi:hypothetical protein